MSGRKETACDGYAFTISIDRWGEDAYTTVTAEKIDPSGIKREYPINVLTSMQKLRKDFDE